MLFPRATVRLQLHRGQNLDDAARQVDYYAALGVSHLYLSPVFQSRVGSLHGYDVTDPTVINSDLGGEPAMRRLVERVREHRMGIILDIVPNHMAALSPDNPWWTDVLRKGRRSPHASTFDIDWDRQGLRGKVLLPLLGVPYGESLANGEIRLAYDTETEEFQITCPGGTLPLSPESETKLRNFQESAAAGGREALLARCNANDAKGRRLMHALLQAQHYRLAWWRTAADAINWRRFFEISELIGVRVEDPDVFELTHSLIFRLYKDGWIDGVRIDHVDGLADPGGYCRRLRSRLEQLTAERPETAVSRPYIIVEKILGETEPLRSPWMVDGTTGYEFMSDVCAVLHDPDGEKPFNELWQNIGREEADFVSDLQAARQKMMYENLSSEFEFLCRVLKQLADTALVSRDLTLSMLRRALAALLTQFRVYRTYFHDTERPPEDIALLTQARDAALTVLRSADHPALIWIADRLGAAKPGESYRAGRARRLRNEAVTRFQQLTSPLAAKSLEDTVFYRYIRLLSRNEVGSEPDRFCLATAEFHTRTQQWAERFPHRMLATATHDHKRGEDARARLAVLSEMPQEWSRLVHQWLHREPQQQPGPDRIDRYMLYQTLVGVWPNDLRLDIPQESAAACSADVLRTLEERTAVWFIKALREAKRHTSWNGVNEGYEETCLAYLRSLFAQMHEERNTLREIGGLVEAISPAGAVNSLAQMVLRLTAPGVPDLYQGTEQWDFSLVDPDNRRPVDMTSLRASLDEAPGWEELLDAWRDGRIKQHLLRKVLQYREMHESLLGEGEYVPLPLSGKHRNSCIAYIRAYQGETVVVAVSRLVFSLLKEAYGRAPLPVVPAEVWEDTAISLPRGLTHGWMDVLTGRRLPARDQSALPLAEILAQLPVALLSPV